MAVNSNLPWNLRDGYKTEVTSYPHTGSATASRDICAVETRSLSFPPEFLEKMADAEQKKKRTFRKFTYRGVDLDQLLDMSYEQIMQLYCARQRRRLNRGLRRKQNSLLKRLRKAKKEAPPMEKPEVIKTHLRDMIILPEMVGSMVGVYNGKAFNQVEIKPEMIGHYLGEFSITYKPVKHGRPGIGATHSSRFIPLK
ncbi:40S ribosomal protein S15 [Hyla sarda]|uniref:40S ribosomal protein S15 n=2 Tax=Hyloidea TaxID=8417 RepID=UPI0024C40B52|nr:40S ribosomal protein S15 [Hyla sarda]